MHSEETVLQPASPCKVVSISDFEGSRKERIEEWLKKEMEERYGEFDSVLDNPLLRISTKFDALSAESQVTLFGFAKGYVLGPGGGHQPERSVMEHPGGGEISGMGSGRGVC